MDRAQPLQHFDTLADTPEAVAKLRKLVLELAVNGRLTPQDQRDEPVELLLAKNDKCRHETAQRDRRADAAPQPLLSADDRWEIADTWSWRALADLVLFVDYRGKTPAKLSSGVRLLTAKNVRKGQINLSPEEYLSEQDYHDWMTRGFPKAGDVLFTTEAPMGNATVVELTERFALAQRVICFQSYGAVDTSFLVMQILSSPFQFILDKNGTGVTAKGIKASKLKQLPIAVPPLAEQRRIVAKVEELLALCDELEARQTAAREHRTRLVRSALDHLTTAKDEPEFRKHSTFFVREFPHFTATVDFIPLLRAGMIGMGVTGALTGGSLTWEEVQLRKVADSRLGKMLDKAKNKGKPLPYLRNTNVQWFRFELSDVKEMLFEDDELDEFSLRKGDLLVCEGGEPGRCAVWDGRLPKMVFQKAIHRVRPNSKLLPEFLAYRLRADATSGRLEKHFTGATIKHFTGQELARYTFSLPPLAEQQRIVAKVDELLRWCDALEARLTAARTTATHLLDATLHQILTA